MVCDRLGPSPQAKQARQSMTEAAKARGLARRRNRLATHDPGVIDRDWPEPRGRKVQRSTQAKGAPWSCREPYGTADAQYISAAVDYVNAGLILRERRTPAEPSSTFDSHRSLNRVFVLLPTFSLEICQHATSHLATRSSSTRDSK
jgi:hypothetical protein